MPTDGCVKCWAPTIGNLFYVIGCFPLWIIDAVKKGFSPSYIYDRLKPRCSSNGKNQGTYWYIPYFFETMAAIPAFILVIQFMAGYHASVSFWIHTKPFIDANIGFNYSAGTEHFDLVWREPYAGRLFDPEKYATTHNRRFGPNIWSPFYNPVETGYSTLLDKELVAGQVVADKKTGETFRYDPQGNGLEEATTKVLIQDMIDNHYNHTAEDMHYTFDGKVVEPEHFITVSHRCMCIGVMPCNSYFGFGCAAGASQKWHRQCKAPSCIKRPERMHYFEINRSEIDVGSYRMTRCRRYAMCIGGLVLGRFFAMIFCRTQLRRPGSGAYNGWVIAGMCWVLGNYIRWKIIPTLVQGRPGWHKFWRKHGGGKNNIIYAFSYGAYGYLGGFDKALSYKNAVADGIDETEERAKGRWENNVSAMSTYRNTGAIAQLWIIAVSSILANFFGGEAYCTDLSNYAYTSKNLNRYRERVRLANL